MCRVGDCGRSGPDNAHDNATSSIIAERVPPQQRGSIVCIDQKARTHALHAWTDPINRVAPHQAQTGQRRPRIMFFKDFGRSTAGTCSVVWGRVPDIDGSMILGSTILPACPPAHCTRPAPSHRPLQRRLQLQTEAEDQAPDPRWRGAFWRGRIGSLKGGRMMVVGIGVIVIFIYGHHIHTD